MYELLEINANAQPELAFGTGENERVAKSTTKQNLDAECRILHHNYEPAGPPCEVLRCERQLDRER